MTYELQVLTEDGYGGDVWIGWFSSNSFGEISDQFYSMIKDSPNLDVRVIKPIMVWVDRKKIDYPS